MTWWWIHNLIAHPLIILWPRMGHQLHQYSHERLEAIDPLYQRFSEHGKVPLMTEEE